MWDLLSAFHAYIRQAEIYREEAGLFSSSKKKEKKNNFDSPTIVYRKEFHTPVGWLEKYDK